VTPGLTDVITRDRFKSWAQVLKSHGATPLICVAIGHGEHQGEVHVVQVEDMTRDQVLHFLRHAVAVLEKAEGGGL
jgi:hypothetical protein